MREGAVIAGTGLPSLEPLEPRVLLSADADGAGLGATPLLPTGSDQTASAPTIDVGEHVLLADTPNQQIRIYVSGGADVQGLNFTIQVADGGPEAAQEGFIPPPGVDAPGIRDVDVLTGTIFADSNTGSTDLDGPYPDVLPQWEGCTTTTAEPNTVAADGLLATVTIDTTGFTQVQTWDLLMSGTLNGSTDFAGVAASITNGTILLNHLPVADAGGPYAVPEGGTVALDASASYDPDASDEIVLYEWDLDGDGLFGETGFGARHGDEIGTSPTFSAAGLAGPTAWTVSLRVTDNHGAAFVSAPDTVDISIVRVPPSATDDFHETQEDTAVSADAAQGVLANDTQGTGGSLAAVLVSGPAHAADFAFHLDGSFTYTPAANFHGTDTFTYKAVDVQSESPPATVTITVEPVNDLPTADAGGDQDVVDADGDWFQAVTLDASASTDVEGIAAYVWAEAGETIATGAAPTVNLAVGGHTIELTVTDTDGATGTDEMSVFVAPLLGNQPLVLITPVTAGQVASGGTYEIRWYGGDDLTALSLWALGPAGLVLIAQGLSGTDGYYRWDTAGAAPSWQCFVATVHREGETTFSVSPSWLQVADEGAPPPAPLVAPAGEGSAAVTWLSPSGGQAVLRGVPFELRWEALAPADGAANAALYVAGDTGAWALIAADLDIDSGRWLWVTADAAPGQYRFGIALDGGDVPADVDVSAWLAVL